jgi:F0F1-type ATP synthase assembly protein I
MTRPTSQQERQRSTIKAVGRYGGMAFQLLGSCLLGNYLGRWLDTYLHIERPTWAVFLTVLFMLAALYQVYRQLLNDK